MDFDDLIEKPKGLGQMQKPDSDSDDGWDVPDANPVTKSKPSVIPAQSPVIPKSAAVVDEIDEWDTPAAVSVPHT